MRLRGFGPVQNRDSPGMYWTWTKDVIDGAARQEETRNTTS